MNKNYEKAALVFTNRICDDDGNIVKGDTRNLTYQMEARPVAETLEKFNNIKREWEKMAEEDDPEMAKIETAVSVTNFPIVYLDIKMGTEDNRWFEWKMEMVGIEERAVTTTKETILEALKETTKETILEALKELVNKVTPNKTVSEKLGKFGWIKITVENEVGTGLDVDEIGLDAVWGDVFRVCLYVGDSKFYDPDRNGEYEDYNFIMWDSTEYNRSDREDKDKSDTVQTLIESGRLDLEKIAEKFAEKVEHYRPQYE